MASTQDETIVAIATPSGRGAITLIRVSGLCARELVDSQFQRAAHCGWSPRRPFVGRFLNIEGEPIDEVLATFFPAPGSYTGQDLVEISCHGSPVIARQIVETLLKGGGRLAEPGEFTMRAFLNGKMDLAQAEAVRDLIDSQTAFQAKVAAEQLGGQLSRALEPVKEEVVRILCHMETAVEFVEDEVRPAAREELIAALLRADRRLEAMSKTFGLGRIVTEGVRVAIAGKPNSGKSSIFNALLEEDRAIVTDVPGTTRDALTETINLEGIPARLADTAGIRKAQDTVERLGVQKSLQYVRECEAVLFVLDRSVAFGAEDQRIWELVQGSPCVLILNKEDLPPRLEIPEEIAQVCAGPVSVSALKRTHLDDLRETLLSVVVPDRRLEVEGVLITSIRQQRCIELARDHLYAGVEALRAGMSEEFPLYDLRKTLDALGQITGETSTDDILQQIFSTFCIGK